MNDEYKEETRQGIQRIRWTFFAGFGTVLAIIVITSVVGFALNSAGIIGGTIRERVVFENSYQRSAGLKAQIATYEATKAGIESQINNSNLDANTRYNLEAQLRALNIRIAAAKEQQ